jgi:hypothetical protein
MSAKVFEIKELDVNDGIIQAEAMIRKEQSSRASSRQIPRSVK